MLGGLWGELILLGSSVKKLHRQKVILDYGKDEKVAKLSRGIVCPSGQRCIFRSLGMGIHACRDDCRYFSMGVCVQGQKWKGERQGHLQKVLPFSAAKFWVEPVCNRNIAFLFFFIEM